MVNVPDKMGLTLLPAYCVVHVQAQNFLRCNVFKISVLL